MAIRYYALCTELEDDWYPRFESELRSCDWWISAEWAGVDDDDEARRLVKPLTKASSVRVGDDAVVDFGETGLLRVSAMDGAACDVLRAECDGPDDDCERGLTFAIEGASGLMASILCEAVQAIAIGMAGERGWVLIPDGKWWDIEDGSWMG